MKIFKTEQVDGKKTIEQALAHIQVGAETTAESRPQRYHSGAGETDDHNSGLFRGGSEGRVVHLSAFHLECAA